MIVVRLVFLPVLLVVLFLGPVPVPADQTGYREELPLGATIPPADTVSLTAESILFEEPYPSALPETVDSGEAGTGCREEVGDGATLPRVAIIIDDMGYHRKIGNQLLDLGMNLTYSFLPAAPHARELEERAWQQGRDILIHLPMQPRDTKWNPGPGALLLNQPPRDLRRICRQNLAMVPHAIGANNHMGSLFTENRKAMRVVLAELHRQGFFFIDSLTTSRSVGREEARRLGMKTASRDIFLDNIHDRKKVCRQLEKLVSVARRRGWAIGIGHPNRATLEALTRCRELLQKNVVIVGVHELVR